MVRNGMLLLATLVLSACGGAEQAPAPPPKPAAAERLTVVRGDIPQLKPLAAEIATHNQAEALARIGGTLVELRVREGDEVRKGEPIARVVDSRIGYETKAYAAQISAAIAQAAQAQSNLDRVRTLYGKGFVAKAGLDLAVATARTSDAQVAAARAQRSASAENAAQGMILAPASGRVLKAQVPQGSVVMPGMSVATITAGQPLLRIDVPQSLAPDLRVGATVLVRDQVDLGDRAGRVVQLYPAVSGGRVRADAEVPGLTTNLVGRRITVLVDVGNRRGIVVPQRFVSTRYGIDYVDLVSKDGMVMSVPVQTAPTNDPARIELLSGVSPDDVLLAGAITR